VCRKGTVGGAVYLLAVLSVAAFAQDSPGWRKVGGSAVDLALADPATGPVDAVWFSPNGSTLYAKTRAGGVFATTDYETWVPVADPPSEPMAPAAVPLRLPEAGARVIMTSPARLYALGRQLFRSDDFGRSWTNLTAYQSTPVVGPGQNSLAIAPNDENQLILANNFGVWRSHDGGFSWSGLNQFLPNLAVRRIVSLPSGASGIRIAVDGFGILELPPGTPVWEPLRADVSDGETVLRQRYSAVIGAGLSAVAQVGNTVYAGSHEGRIWVSTDGGSTFRGTAVPVDTLGTVERLFVDPKQPWIALAALSGKGSHVLRTTNAGIFWDRLDGNLPDTPAHAVTADRAAGAVYVATDQGIFWAHVDLETASTAPVVWTALSSHLPAARAMDVALDATGLQLYAALDGYGVYATGAPHRLDSVRIVNAADFSTRAAAPGSLLSVIGARIHSVRNGNLEYPVLAASNEESQIQVPFEERGPSVALSLQTPSGTLIRELSVQPVSPAIIVGRDGVPLLWDAETGLPIDFRNGAHSDGRIQIWATGLGRVRPSWPSGLAAPLEDPPSVIASVKAYVDGIAVPVTRATLVPGYVGFYLIEVQLPLVMNAGKAELYITADNQESNHVPLLVER
jgi:uncharacterized protein (TIGR03437 family)